MNNMNNIKRVADWENKYPAFKWCNDLNTGSVSGWYLPSLEELKELLGHLATNPTSFLMSINTTLMNYGYDEIIMSRDVWYWSSSAVNRFPNSAWVSWPALTVIDDNGLVYSSSAAGYEVFNICKVRAIRAF